MCSKTILVMTNLLVFFSASHVHADTLYVPTIHVLRTDGSYMTAPLSGTERGVSRTECTMRAKAWENRYADVIAMAKQTLAERGEYGEIRITCQWK